MKRDERVGPALSVRLTGAGIQVLFISNGLLHATMTQLFNYSLLVYIQNVLDLSEMFCQTQRSGPLAETSFGFGFWGWEFHLLLRMFEGESTRECLPLFLLHSISTSRLVSGVEQ